MKGLRESARVGGVLISSIAVKTIDPRLGLAGRGACS